MNTLVLIFIVCLVVVPVVLTLISFIDQKSREFKEGPRYPPFNKDDER